MSKERLVYLDNNSSSPQDYSCLQQRCGAHFPQPSMHITYCTLVYTCLIGCISHRILACPLGTIAGV